MKQKMIPIKKGTIANNCPECFNTSLTVTFYQKFVSTLISKRFTSEIKYDIVCDKCRSVIYPVSWTDDIERSFNYYQKTVVPQKTTLKFKPLFYILLTIILIGALYGLYYFQLITF